MATTARHDESLVERHEVLFPNTDMIDTEPFYNNFTTIENLLRYSNQQKQLNTLTPTINGCIFNLIQIVEDIGYNSQSPFINSKENNPKNALYNLILKLGGAFGPLVNRRRLNIDKQYFQRWYLEKYPSSASMIQHNLLMKRTTQISDDYQSNINRRSSIITKLPFKRMDDKTFKKQVLSTYGFDDTDTISSISSSRRSSIDETNSTPTRQSTPVILETVNSKPKQQITIREYYPSKDIPSLMASRSISAASQQTTNDNEYEEFIHNHPGLYHDLNPEIIRKSNPDQITYKQNVSVRYLVPPTPPPSGPLIIREIIPPHPPTPPPLIINQQDPTPPTPPPLILREAPPLLPPHQEPTIITKVLPQESSSSSSSSQRVIIERDAPLPPKPQSIIIEKWLPYKPAPPREIIYERIIETPMISEFQPGAPLTDRQRRHSADYSSTSSTRIPIPVHIDRQNSYDHLEPRPLSLFEQFALSTQRHLEAIQAQHQRNMNMFTQNLLPLTTPTLVVNYPPVTRIVQREDFQQEMFYDSTFMYPTYM